MQQISQNCTKGCKENQRSKLEQSKTSPDKVPLSASLKHLLSSSPSNTKAFQQRTHVLGKGCNKLHRSVKLWLSWHAQRGLTVTPLRLAFCLCKFTPQLMRWGCKKHVPQHDTNPIYHLPPNFRQSSSTNEPTLRSWLDLWLGRSMILSNRSEMPKKKRLTTTNSICDPFIGVYLFL